MERLTHQLFFWSEMVGNLASLDLYVFSMASKEVSMSFHEHVVFKNLVFKVEDLARRRAWSILRMIHSPQKLICAPGRAHCESQRCIQNLDDRCRLGRSQGTFRAPRISHRNRRRFLHGIRNELGRQERAHGCTCVPERKC